MPLTSERADAALIPGIGACSHDWWAYQGKNKRCLSPVAPVQKDLHAVGGSPSIIMPKRKLRIVKRFKAIPLLGICERCQLQFVADLNKLPQPTKEGSSRY